MESLRGSTSVHKILKSREKARHTQEVGIWGEGEGRIGKPLGYYGPRIRSGKKESQKYLVGWTNNKLKTVRKKVEKREEHQIFSVT